jgi:membrane protein DedA with SNARE-associated domain
MGELEGFLRVYGLWALFFFAAFEGDLTLLLAGMLVHLGIWPPGKTLAIAATGGWPATAFTSGSATGLPAAG